MAICACRVCCVHRVYLSHVTSSHSHRPESSLAQSSPPHMERGFGEWVIETTEDGGEVASVREIGKAVESKAEQGGL